ncbi:hypothetical protein A1O1_06991 [Capronia coronata CBS 617.96]|uniref:SHSP domain-containing protein n=1 Tax=Capronia coronata CBS 617.96 TaxID=1182541 RepID=W9Y188_9EURO|nr:uncharacterized protein A1O1_06991 [Capronia coronata CBS 617.96]EXJ83370.1 hypothetical protein A1O1_06991 [Capronia coronata CBS 617.96]
MNPPPNPFWDFVNGIEDHPFFAQYRGPFPPGPPPPQRAQARPEASPEDPPEVDPSTLRGQAAQSDTNMPFRGRGRFENAFNREGSGSSSSSSSSESDGEGRRRTGGRGPHGPGTHHHHHGHHGPHGHGPWGGRGGHRGPPPFAGGPFMFGPPPHAHGPPGSGRRGAHPPPPPPAAGSEGPQGRGPFGWSRGRGGCSRGRPGHHGPSSRSHPRDGPFGGSGPFDMGNFLNNLGERLGVDLTSAAEGLGLDIGRYSSPRSHDSDFEPRTDIFDTASQYLIHLSLPGAKKSDVGVEWDGEHSLLRVTGVVHRPGVDEETLSHLVVDGRKRETGVFEKNIRLGTEKEPVDIDVSGIAAKMIDGVLVISVPKNEKTRFQKREVRIDSSPSVEKSNEKQHEDINMDEHDVDATSPQDHDGEMYDTEATPAKASSSSSSKVIEKQREAEQEHLRDDRSKTLGFNHPDATVETLPLYEVEDRSVKDNKTENGHAQQQQSQGQERQDVHAHVDDEEEMSDWEKAGSDDEGEGDYVKINVD